MENRKLIITILISIILNISLLIINISENKCQYPIDYIIKDNLDQCYLSVHNIISINTSLKNNNWTNNYFHTYISSFTKPFLLELVQNSTQDCLCCN